MYSKTLQQRQMLYLQGIERFYEESEKHKHKKAGN